MMKWKATIFLMLSLLLLSACASQSQTAPTVSEDAGQQVETAEADVEASAQQSDTTVTEVSSQPVVTVYKSPTCGCCSGWVGHMEEAGFMVETHDIDDLAAVKDENQVPSQLRSCHTAIVDGYVIEGHVPIEDVSQLLAERPDVAGIAVPGMPVGSPGMEVDGYDAQPFDVISFDQAGNLEIFASHSE